MKQVLSAPQWRSEAVVCDGPPLVKVVEIGSDSFLALFYSKSQQVEEFNANSANLLKFTDSKYQAIAVQHLFETSSDYVIVCEKAAVLSRQTELGYEDVSAEGVLDIAQELLHSLKEFHAAGRAGLSLQPDKLTLKEDSMPMIRLLDLAQLKQATPSGKHRDINALGQLLALLALGSEDFDPQNLKVLLERKFGSEGTVLHKLLSEMIKTNPLSATLLLDDIRNNIQKELVAAQNCPLRHSKTSVEPPHHTPSSPNVFTPQPARLNGFEESKAPSFPLFPSHREIYYLEERATELVPDSRFDPTEVTKSFRFAMEWLQHGQEKFARRYLCAFMQTLAQSSATVKVRLNAVPLKCCLCQNLKERSVLYKTVCLHYTCASCLMSAIQSSGQCVCKVPIQLQAAEKPKLPRSLSQAYTPYEWQLS